MSTLYTTGKEEHMTNNKTFWVARGGRVKNYSAHENAFVRRLEMKFGEVGYVERHLQALCYFQFSRTTGIKLKPGEQRKFRLVEVK
jgi:hypothetical protein